MLQQVKVNDWSRRRVLQAIGAGVVLGSLGAPVRASSQTEWPQAGYDGANTSYSPAATGPQKGVERTGSYLADRENRIASAVVSDGRVYAIADRNLLAIDIESGSEDWRQGQEAAVSSVVVGDGTVYVGLRSGELRALDLESGTTDWQRELDGPVQTVRLADGLLYLGTSASVYAIDPTTAATQWRTAANISSRLAVRGANIWADLGGPGLLAITPQQTEEAGWGDNAVQIGSVDGRSVVRYTETTWIDNSPPALGQDSVYIGGFGVQAVGLGDGRVRWRFGEEEIAVSASPAVTDSRVYVGSGTEIEDVPDERRQNAGTVYALDAADGTVDWTFETDGPVNTSPVVAQTTVYVTSDDSYVYALDRTTGELQWRRQLRETDTQVAVGTGIGEPILSGRQLLVRTDQSGLFAFGEPRDSGQEGEQTGQASADENGGETGTASSEDSDDSSGPGFGIPAGLTALGGAGYLLRRRFGPDRGDSGEFGEEMNE